MYELLMDIYPSAWVDQTNHNGGYPPTCRMDNHHLSSLRKCKIRDSGNWDITNTYINHALYILVKALSQVLYDKIQHKGWGQVANAARGKAECCICQGTPPCMLYFIVQHK